MCACHSICHRLLRLRGCASALISAYTTSRLPSCNVLTVRHFDFATLRLCDFATARLRDCAAARLTLRLRDCGTAGSCTCAPVRQCLVPTRLSYQDVVRPPPLPGMTEGLVIPSLYTLEMCGWVGVKGRSFARAYSLTHRLTHTHTHTQTQ